MNALETRWRDAENHIQAYLEMTGDDLSTMMLSSPPCHKLAQAACSLVAMELAHRISLRGTDGGPDEPIHVECLPGSEPCVVDSPLASGIPIFDPDEMDVTCQPGEEPIRIGGVADENEPNPED